MGLKKIPLIELPDQQVIPWTGEGYAGSMKALERAMKVLPPNFPEEGRHHPAASPWASVRVLLRIVVIER